MSDIQNKVELPDARQSALAFCPFGTASTLVLALGTFAVGTDAFIVAAFLPRAGPGLAVTPAAAGLSVTAFALAYAVLAPVIAAAMAPLPRRALLVGASSCSASLTSAPPQFRHSAA